MLEWIKRFFFNECMNCGEEHQGEYIYDLCDICRQTLRVYVGCFQCLGACVCNIKTIIPYFYHGVIVSLILRFKYQNYTLFSDFFANEMRRLYPLFTGKNFVFVPIPMTKAKLKIRGYNQSVLLCKSLKHKFGGEVAYFALEKPTDLLTTNKSELVNRTTQKHSDAKNRFINASSMILGDISTILNKDIMIVDDVISSGATVQKVIALLEPYAKTITVIACAKT